MTLHPNAVAWFLNLMKRKQQNVGQINDCCWGPFYPKTSDFRLENSETKGNSINISISIFPICIKRILTN